MAKNLHVIPQNGEWAVRREGSTLLLGLFETKREAIDTARKAAETAGGEVLIHGRSNQIFYKAEIPSQLSEERIRTAVRGVEEDAIPAKRHGRSHR